MSRELNFSDDLFDDEIHQTLRTLGFTFPKTIDDFGKLLFSEEIVGEAPPEDLRDPYVFLKAVRFKKHMDIKSREIGQDYSQKFAQAAREGNKISDEVKKKMEEDRRRASLDKKKKE